MDETDVPSTPEPCPCDCGCEPTDEWHSEPRCACRALGCPCVLLEPCCSYPHLHEHYPDWLRHYETIAVCKCGQHVVRMTTETLLRVWAESRKRRLDKA